MKLYSVLTAIIILAFFMPLVAGATQILVPMDDSQQNHLRAYGVAFWTLDENVDDVNWLLNYRGGSFLINDHDSVRERARTLGVTVETVSQAQVQEIFDIIEYENMERVLLEKAPKIGVYSPNYAEPWADAVIMALTYADIPFETFFDKEVMRGDLEKYDWIHLHHEDFTGQFGKFYGSFRFADWYRQQVTRAQLNAQELGFNKVTELKLAVAKKIRQFVKDGGFMFAMCSATETLDIALAADGVDIVEKELDGDGLDPLYQSKLNFDKTFAFRDFTLITDPMIYAFSDIDVSNNYIGDPGTFRLFEFAAKVDPIPTMMTQNHRNVIDGFFGQTTAFRRSLLKPNVVVLAENNDGVSVKYIYADYGEGFFTFYGGHCPADVAHLVGEGPTNLALHTNNPGYRLILNNVLFPAARRKERKT